MFHPRILLPSFVMLVCSLSIPVQAQLAKGATKFLGNCGSSSSIASAPDYASLWTQMTPEVGGLWRNVEQQRDQMNWKDLDSTYAYSKRNGIIFQQNVFAIGSSQAAWISGFPPDTIRAEFEEWVAAFAARYPDTRIATVVAEPKHSRPPWSAALGGAGVTGYDWVIEAFRITRKYLPNTILLLEDYNVLNYETDSFLVIANKVKAAGYLDAVGCQGHMLETLKAAVMKANLEKVATLGVPIYITQYDLGIENDSLQRAVLSQQFPVLWESPYVAGITMWGFVYGKTQSSGSGLIKEGVDRPAMTWLREYVAKNLIQPMPKGGLRNDGTIQGASTGIGLRQTSGKKISGTRAKAAKDLGNVEFLDRGTSWDALGRP